MATEQLTVPLAGRCVGKLQLTAVAAVVAALKMLLQLLLFTQLTVSIEEGFIQKRRLKSSLLLGGQNLFHSLPR